MKKTNLWMIAILFISFLIVSCDKDETVVDEAKVLIEWMESTENPAGKYYANTDMGEYTTASALKDQLTASKAYVIDIRGESAYDAGHISGAVNLTESEVSDHITNTDLSAYDNICIACASGQTAAWLTALLNMEGHTNVTSLKFGMCSWNPVFADAWNNGISNEKSTLFTAAVTEKAAEGDLPGFSTGYETAADIFAARLDAVIAEGFGAAAVTNGAVYDNLNNYYIINYWDNDDYIGMKHIEGAVQYTPKVDIALDVALKTLPTDKKIAVYCYSGQGSANLCAYLRLIGYDAVSIKYGANGMIHDEMTKSFWKPELIMNYDYDVNP